VVVLEVRAVVVPEVRAVEVRAVVVLEVRASASRGGASLGKIPKD